MKVGIIGLPNVGKSTLFKALTKKQVNISNYPFCTIDPNIGLIAVPDERLDKLAQVIKSKEVIPTTLEFVDIAGLVKNAHQGQGLGNQFLSHIREVDALVEVVRNFQNKNVAHIEGDVNPERDKNIIQLELTMADLQTIEKRLGKIEKEAKSGNAESLKSLKILKSLKQVLDQGKLANEVELNEEEKIIVKDLNLLTMKPIIFVMNINKESDSNNFIEIDCKIESELVELSDQEIKELGFKKTGLDKLIRATYNILDLITFFTFNQKELRAWTMVKGTKAPKAAGKIHTDFEKGFIRADVCNWKNLVEVGGEVKAKEKGLIRLEGKDYVVQDGDVIYFRVTQ